MSLLRCVCNTTTGQWDFAPFDLHHNYCDVEVLFTSSSDISGIQYGLSVSTDGQKRYEQSFNEAFAYTYDNQDDYFNSIRIDYPVANSITVDTWATTNDGQTHTGTYEFSRPTPPQPFPSWTLVDGHWSPPTPFPADGLDYMWDEVGGAWVQVEFDEATQTWIEVQP